MNRSTEHSTEKKDKKINLRMSYELYHKIERDAKACSTKNISEYIRKCLSEAPVVQNVVQDSDEVVQLSSKDTTSHPTAKDPKPRSKEKKTGLKKFLSLSKVTREEGAPAPKPATLKQPETIHFYLPPKYTDQDRWEIIWNIILFNKYPDNFPEGWDIYSPNNTLESPEPMPEPISIDINKEIAMLSAHKDAKKPAMLRSTKRK